MDNILLTEFYYLTTHYLKLALFLTPSTAKPPDRKQKKRFMLKNKNWKR
jgi:hypothetical protein